MKKSLGAIALVSLFALFSPAGPAPADAAEVRIGVLMDFSGPLAALSPAIEGGGTAGGGAGQRRGGAVRRQGGDGAAMRESGP